MAPALCCLNLPRFWAKRMCGAVFIGRRSNWQPTTSAASICFCTTSTTTFLILRTEIPWSIPITGTMSPLMRLPPIPLIRFLGRANQPTPYQRSLFLPSRFACPAQQGRPCLYHTHALLTLNIRHSGDCWVTRCALSWRCRAKDSKISDRQQLYWCGNPTATWSVFWHHHCHLHHRFKEAKKHNKTLFIDASAEFVRGGNKNKLTNENHQKILAAFKNRQDSEYFAKLVDNQKIGANDYNIAVSSYVVQEDTREVIDITQLNAEISRIAARQSELRTAIDVIVTDIEGSS